MSLDILPNELNEEPTRHRIKTRVPFDKIKDEMLVKRARAANLSAGDEIRVMSCTHDYDEVLAQATYLITSRRESTERIDTNDRDIRYVQKTDLTVKRLGGWEVFAKAEENAAIAAMEEAVLLAGQRAAAPPVLPVVKPVKGKKAA